MVIAIDLGSGKAVRVTVVDAGKGLSAGQNAAGQYFSVEPQSGHVSWTGLIGEFEAFSIDGNVISFYSVNGNPTQNVWLFGISKKVDGLAGA
jgi:hypothetical protein